MLAKIYDDLAGADPERFFPNERRDLRAAARWCIGMWDMREARVRAREIEWTEPLRGGGMVDELSAELHREAQREELPARRRRG